MTLYDFTARLSSVLNVPTGTVRPLHGGMIGQVFRVELADGRTVVAKIADSGGALDIEGYMLRYLREHSALPVPDVLHSEPSLLVMTFVEGSSHFSEAAEQHAADLLAALHAVTASAFGLERDTLIGPLHQPNPWTPSWIAFFRDQRLRYMAQLAADSGRLPTPMLGRVERLAERLDSLLEEPEQPSLIHGDVWSTNVLATTNRVSAFLDPAIYYAHHEMELAYVTLFNTFGAAFFERYHALRPIEPGFFEVRRDIYNLYPLLVHVRLFGGGYVSSVDRVLRR
ncbi:MAG: fructosamine kinase family protein, partial [Aggregatilineales bacterium]